MKSSGVSLGVKVCLVLFPFSAGAATYYPSGPQTNVSLATITSGGWTECYSATMAASIGNNDSSVLASCNESFIMMAGGLVGSEWFAVVVFAELVMGVRHDRRYCLQ